MIKIQSNWCANSAEGNSKAIHLNGAAAYPGFTDAHGHLIGIGLREMTLNLEGTASIKDLQARLAEVVANTPEGQTIYGRGWIETHWPEARFPNKSDLDAVTTSHPVILERADGHASVVNSLALSTARITDDTANPFGGAINRDASGEATGMLIDNAATLVQPLLPGLTDARKREAYIRGAELYASRGWTKIRTLKSEFTTRWTCSLHARNLCPTLDTAATRRINSSQRGPLNSMRMARLAHAARRSWRPILMMKKTRACSF